MTTEIATRLLPIYQKDYKKYRFKAASIELNGKYWANKEPAIIRQHKRLCQLFHITKALYVETKLFLESQPQ